MSASRSAPRRSESPTTVHLSKPIIHICTSSSASLAAQSVLELSIRLLLNSLRVLQLLDQLHFEHLHLHDLLLLRPNHRLLLGHPLVRLRLRLELLPPHELLLLQLRDPLLLLNHLILLCRVRLRLRIEDVLALLVLDLNDSLLFHLLLLAQVDCLLDLLTLNFTLSAHIVDSLLGLLLDHLIHTEGLHLLLDLHLVLLLEGDDLGRTLLGLLYLLPGTHLLLLEEGNAVG